MDTNENSLEIMTIQEVDEIKRKEDRKRRNRESAAKCRQKLKDKLVTAQRVVTHEEYRNKALKNEISLVDIEYKKIMVVLRQHSNHCNLPNNGYNSQIARNNGIHNNFITITAQTSSQKDVNNNPSNSNRKDNKI